MNHTSTTTSTSATPLVCACGTPLTGGRDTFGEPGKPAVCAACWLRKADHDQKRGAYFDRGDTAKLDSWVNEVMEFDPHTHELPFIPTPLDAFCAAADRALLLGDAPTVQEVGA